MPFRAPYVTAAGSATHREAVLCEVATGGGLVGVGEASLLPHSASSADAFWTEIQNCANGAGTTRRRPRQAPGSRAGAGLEVAASDIAARAEGRPLARAIGEDVQKSVPVNALVSKPGTAEGALAAKDAVAAGFGTIKLKVGMARTAAEEVQRVDAVRRAIGRGVRLRLDANGTWSESQAIETLLSLSAYDLEYVEQPVAPGNIVALKRVRDAVTVSIAADEDVVDRPPAMAVLQSEAAGLLILKPLTLGGIGITQDIRDRAARAGIGSTITTSIDFGVGTAVALHLAAALGGRAAGLATLDLLESSLVREELPIVDGCMRLPDGPGLGVTLDMDAVNRYTVAAASFVAP